MTKFDYSKYWQDQEYVTLFHGTTRTKAHSIMANGLRVSCSGHTEGYAYLTTSPAQAWLYAAEGGEVENGGYAVIAPQDQVLIVVKIPPALLEAHGWLRDRSRFEQVTIEVLRDPSFDPMGEFTIDAPLPSRYVMGVINDKVRS